MILTSKDQKTDLPIACNLTAIPAEQIFLAVEETCELPDGYAFPLPGEPEILSRAAEFIKYERLCCPFLSFALEVKPQGEPFRLKLTGPEGVKQFLLFELNLENKRIV